VTKYEAQQLAALYGPMRGGVYRHYKGGLYSVVGTGVKEDTLEIMVAYISNSYGGLTFRTLDNWNELIDGKPRFERVQP
jgi:hypothetical protein